MPMCMARTNLLPPGFKELNALIRAGKVFAVQDWIAQGKPVSAPDSVRTPLLAAVAAGSHSMVELILQAGVTAQEKDDALMQSVVDGRRDLLEMLITSGAEPRSLSFDEVRHFARSDIFKTLLSHGLSAEHSSIASGLVRQDEDDLLFFSLHRSRIPGLQQKGDIALRGFVEERGRHCDVKWVKALLEAGANPRARVPHIARWSEPEENWGTAFDASVAYAAGAVTLIFGIDATADNLDDLLFTAGVTENWKLFDALIALGANPNSPGKESNLLEAAFDALRHALSHHNRRKNAVKITMDQAERILRAGGRWGPGADGIRNLKTILRRLSAPRGIALVAALRETNALGDGVLHALLTDPAVADRLAGRSRRKKKSRATIARD